MSTTKVADISRRTLKRTSVVREDLPGEEESCTSKSGDGEEEDNKCSAGVESSLRFSDPAAYYRSAGFAYNPTVRVQSPGGLSETATRSSSSDGDLLLSGDPTSTIARQRKLQANGVSAPDARLDYTPGLQHCSTPCDPIGVPYQENGLEDDGLHPQRFLVNFDIWPYMKERTNIAEIVPPLHQILALAIAAAYSAQCSKKLCQGINFLCTGKVGLWGSMRREVWGKGGGRRWGGVD